MDARLQEALAQLEQPQADMDYRPGHDRVRALLANLHLTEPMLRIRVAGTNGKGSTCHMLSNGLITSGKRVGLYTSPHIVRFNERIRINGEPVSDAVLLRALDVILPLAERIGTSPFETATALALYIFHQNQVDIQILEAGVGARLDTSTAVAADMALITPIGLDHQAWLGEDLAAIAQEKAHIMNGCRWAFTGDNTQADTVLPILQHHHPVQLVARDTSLQCAMAGLHQQDNASLALAAIACLEQHHVLQVHQARAAVTATVATGRMQPVAYGTATLWLDAAHNMHAIEALLPWLAARSNLFEVILLCPREDRDLSAAVPLLSPYARRVLYQQVPLHEHRKSVREAVESVVNNNVSSNYLLLGSFQSIAAMLACS